MSIYDRQPNPSDQRSAGAHQRRHQRFSLTRAGYVVELDLANQQVGPMGICGVRDISRGGASIVCRHPLAVGGVVVLMLEAAAPSPRLTIPAKVVNLVSLANEMNRVGVAFLAATPPMAPLIAAAQQAVGWEPDAPQSDQPQHPAAA